MDSDEDEEIEAATSSSLICFPFVINNDFMLPSVCVCVSLCLSHPLVPELHQ